jgi:hypothetical protein
MWDTLSKKWHLWNESEGCYSSWKQDRSFARNAVQRSLRVNTNHKHHWDRIIMMQYKVCTHENSRKHSVCSNYIQKLKRKAHLNSHQIQQLIKSNFYRQTLVPLLSLQWSNCNTSLPQSWTRHISAAPTLSSFNSLFAGWLTNIRHDTSESSLFPHFGWSCLVFLSALLPVYDGLSLLLCKNLSLWYRVPLEDFQANVNE